MSSVLKRFAERLHYLRSERGLTQEALASKSKLAAGYISELERARKIPSLTSLDQLAHGLGVDISQLVNFTSAEEKEDRGLDEVALLLRLIRNLPVAEVRRVRRAVEGMLSK